VPGGWQAPHKSLMIS